MLFNFCFSSMSPLAAILSEHQNKQQQLGHAFENSKRKDMLKRVSVASALQPPPADSDPPKLYITATRIELFSRVFFPSSFFTVFTIYWLYYYVYMSNTRILPSDADWLLISYYFETLISVKENFVRRYMLTLFMMNFCLCLTMSSAVKMIQNLKKHD